MPRGAVYLYANKRLLPVRGRGVGVEILFWFLLPASAKRIGYR
jgi:hypothetical protein